MRIIDRINLFFARRRALKHIATMWLQEYGDPAVNNVPNITGQPLVAIPPAPTLQPYQQTIVPPSNDNVLTEQKMNELVKEINNPIVAQPLQNPTQARMDIINRKAGQVS